MEKMMKAVAVMEKGVVRVVDVEMPDYDAYGCLVRVTACGFCSSTDMKIIRDEMADIQVKYPTILGHECVGVIAAVGDKVRTYHVGDRITCARGNCFKSATYSSTFGQMAQYCACQDVYAMQEDGIDLVKAIPGRQPTTLITYPTRRTPDWMSDVDAVMILSFEENYSALLNFGVREGMDVLIIGDGTVARGLAYFAEHIGVRSIVCAGHHDDKLARIRDQVRATVVNTNTESLDDALAGRTFDVAIDAVGSMQAVLDGARRLRPGGKVCVYGVHKREKANINFYDLPSNTALHVLPWPHQEHRVHDEIVSLIQSGRLNPKDYYSHVLPMEEIGRALELVQSREAHKVIMTME